MSTRNMTTRISFLLLASGQLSARAIASTAHLACLASTVGGAATSADVPPGNHERVMVLNVNKDDDAADTLVHVRPRSRLGLVRLGEASVNSETAESKDITAARISAPVSKRGRYAIIASLNTTANQPGTWTIAIPPLTAVNWWLVLQVAAASMLIGLLLCLFARRRIRRKREEPCRNVL